MTLRLLAVPVLMFGASTAFAQAPGDYAPPPPPEPLPIAPARPSVMAHRWSIGLGVGAIVVARGDMKDGDTNKDAVFSVGELALRYRVAPNYELELAASGGRQIEEDGEDVAAADELAMGSITVALRYHVFPEHRWDFSLIGGVGGTVIAARRSSDDARDAATRPLAMVGLGLARRFDRFALHVEMRSIYTGQRDDGMVEPDVRSPRSRERAIAYGDDLVGGQFTLGASYAF